MHKSTVLVCILFLLIQIDASSQNLKVCTFYDYMTPTDFISKCGLNKRGQVDFNMGILDSFLLDFGLEKNFVLKECRNLNNPAAAMIDPYFGTMERYVAFPENILENTMHYNTTNWRYFGQLMHAIGHQLFRHALIDGLDNRTEELIADEFSGYMSARMEASLEESLSSLQSFKSESQIQDVFPKVDARKEAITKGWSMFVNGSTSQEFSSSFLPAKTELDKERDSSGTVFKRRILKFNSANKAMRKMDYDKAQMIYQELLSNGINSLSKANQQNIFKHLGFIYFVKKNEEMAVDYFRIAHELNPSEMYSLLKMIEIRKQQGKPEKTISLLKEALKIRPRNATLYLDIGDASLLLGDVKYAVIAYNRALILKPKLVNTRINLAKIYVTEGNELTRMMQTRDPEKRQKIDYKKFRKLREELYLKAIVLLEEGLTTNPESLPIKRNLYKLYVSLKDKKYLRRMKETMIDQ